jgi:hypothetical protein
VTFFLGNVGRVMGGMREWGGRKRGCSFDASNLGGIVARAGEGDKGWTRGSTVLSLSASLSGNAFSVVLSQAGSYLMFRLLLQESVFERELIQEVGE